MSNFDSRHPRNKLAVLSAAFLLVLLASLGSAYYVLRPRLESDPPKIALQPATDMLGVAPLEIRISDEGTGLKSIHVTLSMGSTEAVIAEKFDPPLRDKTISLALPKLSGVREGPAVLKVTAVDGSLRNFGAGNEAVVQQNVTIDLTPPTLGLVADDRYISFGGVGALTYKASPDTVTSGVKLGDQFFPGVQGTIKGHADHYFVLFAHAYNTPPEAKAMLVATDKAGNTRQMPLAYRLKDVRFRESTIAISDNFLQNKVAPLLRDGAAAQKPAKEVFIAVNKAMRKENEDKILEITRKATPAMLWKDAFTQLSNSKVEASFADRRTYVYNGEPVDTAYHLGFDLSVTRNSPVEAANAGKVAFTGDLGIYGNTVILDHGLGLHTLYSHLSAIDVKAGDSVEQRQILGKTGETGLAAGDHLHYGVYLHGVAVLPAEWWDAKWIRDNVQPKLDGGDSQGIAEAQEVKRIPRTAYQRRRR